MKILLSNDDGVFAPGLKILYDALQDVAEELIIFAPDRDQSGSSKSLTVSRPLIARTLEKNIVMVEGTPTDCVHLALTAWLQEAPPDIVISGINAGANLGDDVLYSGTVAAASEAHSLGVPAIAVSLVGPECRHYHTAALLIKKLLSRPWTQDLLINVNVPDVPPEQLQGHRVCRLGQRHPSQKVIEDTDPRGRPIYWIGPPGAAQDIGQDTDFYYISHNYATITPLQMDLTDTSQMAALNSLTHELG